ncbi:MAG TPA: GGDEF domain-containing protein [Gemmatimonadales bacterium]|jgi:diguanylate cyclase (GGDEF)-like protein|nr:GGDEF domain-containing protein [Gemmatimonadales bacterium]
MPILASPVLRQVLRLSGYLLLTLLVYWANALTPSTARFGILYTIPVLLVTWTEGLAWGIVFAAATTVFREATAWVQMPADTAVHWRILNALAYLAVLGVAMAGLQTLRRSQALLARLVTQDPLTNVLNARAFADRLGQELDRNRRYPRPLALMYMDLDNFKVINDTHGHQTGDAVLRLVADAMRSSVRQADVVGRLGGDEFAVLMPETDAQLADAAARRLIAGLRNVFKGTPNVTASIGVVSCTATEASTDDLLRRADQAMYDAKKSGKDRVVQVAI